MMHLRTLFPIQWLSTVTLVAAPGWAQEPNFEKVQVRSSRVADGIHVLAGAGGNVGVAIGDSGVILVDDQFAPLTPKILAAVKALTPLPIRFVLNTHWHEDHTGGNENMRGAGAVIVAHENVRKRMSTEQFLELFKEKVPPSSPAALPGVTFTDAVTFHLDGQEIHAFHVRPAHTDGDVIVHFRTANVVHMGDIFANGEYPYIDVASGGSVDGMIAAAERVLRMIGPDTKVIPGHGPVGDQSALRAYRDMLAGARARVMRHVAAGASLERTIAAKPTAEFDSTWGKGFFSGAQFTEMLHSDLSRRKRAQR
ncbi:MAG TPA: MBL fold metallo-hydrolase [Gemmatimonadales bacterium]|nr:MBL fold metallo-hydrolase [Gemmatimonadales bacterium]